MAFCQVRFSLVVFTLFGCLVFFHAPVAHAEISIAVVDVDQLLSETKDAKSVQKQVDSKRKGFIDQIKNEEDKLRAEQKAIESKRKDMSKEELMKKAQEFEKKRMDARKTIQDKKSKLDKSYSEAMGILTKAIYEVCQDIAKEKSYDLVITRQNIIVGSKNLDITAEVLIRMDKKLPNLSLQEK